MAKRTKYNVTVYEKRGTELVLSLEFSGLAAAGRAFDQAAGNRINNRDHSVMLSEVLSDRTSMLTLAAKSTDGYYVEYHPAYYTRKFA